MLLQPRKSAEAITTLKMVKYRIETNALFCFSPLLAGPAHGQSPGAAAMCVDPVSAKMSLSSIVLGRIGPALAFGLGLGFSFSLRLEDPLPFRIAHLSTRCQNAFLAPLPPFLEDGASFADLGANPTLQVRSHQCS